LSRTWLRRRKCPERGPLSPGGTYDWSPCQDLSVHSGVGSIAKIGKRHRAGPPFKGQENQCPWQLPSFKVGPAKPSTFSPVLVGATVTHLARCFVSTSCRSEDRMAASILFFHSFLSSWHTSLPSRGRSTDMRDLDWSGHGHWTLKLIPLLQRNQQHQRFSRSRCL